MGKFKASCNNKNKVPRNPTRKQSAGWHIEHLKHCSYRMPTLNIQKLMNERKEQKKYVIESKA